MFRRAFVYVSVLPRAVGNIYCTCVFVSACKRMTQTTGENREGGGKGKGEAGP